MLGFDLAPEEVVSSRVALLEHLSAWRPRLLLRQGDLVSPEQSVGSLADWGTVAAQCPRFCWTGLTPASIAPLG